MKVLQQNGPHKSFTVTLEPQQGIGLQLKPQGAMYLLLLYNQWNPHLSLTRHCQRRDTS